MKGFDVSKTGFKLTGKWDELGTKLDPKRFDIKMKEELRRATELNSKITEREVRKKIGKSSQAGWDPLSNLTMDIKRSKGMLFDKGELFKAITSKVVSYKSAFIGVLRTAKGKGGQQLANVALVLHEGASIKVTQKMRRMFWALWAARVGIIDPANLVGRAREIWERTRGKAEIYKLSGQTTAIRIPSRPFIREVFENKDLLVKLKNNWEKAVDTALKRR